MINGDDIKAARQRAGLSREQFASRVEVSLRTVGNWERGASVPRDREHVIRTVLADHLDDGTGSPLRAASDVELLLEVARRMERTRTQGGGERGDTAPKTGAGDPGAQSNVVQMGGAGGRRLSTEPSEDGEGRRAAYTGDGRGSRGRADRADQDAQGEAPDPDGPEGGA